MLMMLSMLMSARTACSSWNDGGNPLTTKFCRYDTSSLLNTQSKFTSPSGHGAPLQRKHGGAAPVPGQVARTGQGFCADPQGSHTELDVALQVAIWRSVAPHVLQGTQVVSEVPVHAVAA